MKIELKEVVSSNIAKIGYDEQTSTLYVKFRSGALWSYNPVPPEEYQALKEAQSVGKYFVNKIRPNIAYEAREVLEDLEDTA